MPGCMNPMSSPMTKRILGLPPAVCVGAAQTPVSRTNAAQMKTRPSRMPFMGQQVGDAVARSQVRERLILEGAEPDSGAADGIDDVRGRDQRAQRERRGTP